MIKRRITIELEKTLKRSASVALMGPRQVGKTTLARDIEKANKSVYLDLERKRDLQRIQDIEAFHTENRDKLIILDEVQRLPDIFQELRGIIDEERRRGHKYGQFLFLGSASMDLLQQSGESLAGRISYLELCGIDALEFGALSADKLNQLWLRGGFPESLLAASDEDSLIWRNDFIRTYLERDIPLLGPRIPAETLERFWTMLAHIQGGIFNASMLAKSLEVSSVTVSRYLDLMVDLLLVRRLQPWTANIGKRLVKSPKVYVRDSGITHALLNIERYNDLLGHPVSGGSWEGFVIENIISVAPNNAKAYYYRSSSGHEIDLILEFSGRETWAIEIKRSTVPVLSKGFYQGCEDVKADKKFVVYGGHDQFALQDGVTAIPLVNLMQQLVTL
ncbi:ATP-binding protein [Mucilaginibacter limnophilus]|uniref:ATP-binding protein n=1 Tax=Mucilaginibacter limnophilus TaxID=1932778 RepID=A0A3S3TIX8_9SPHI|nr:ATP-binding protein [Mucilaginibacter limnophilus]RVU02060.1 ATP-binding protein [Mucilaginibacter limnophilus]RVU02089.1 ATP-binding protein [Mucilaginibacter limnophilus]